MGAIAAAAASAIVVACWAYGKERSESLSSIREIFELGVGTGIFGVVLFAGDCLVGAIFHSELPWLQACTGHIGFSITVGVCGLILAGLVFAAIRLGIVRLVSHEG